MRAGAWFGRVAAWAARHARLAARRQRRPRRRRRGGGDPAADRRRRRHPRRLRLGDRRGDPAGPRGLRRRTGRRPRQGRTAANCCSTDDLFRLLRLEGCLSGKVPKGAKPIPGPCAELAEMGAVEFLTGPATFLNESVVQIDNQLQRLAEHVPADRFREYLLAVATRYGITSAPSITNEDFVATVVFDLAQAARDPEGPPLLPLPQRQLGPDRDPAEAGPERSRTPAGDRADRSRGRGHDAAQGLRAEQASRRRASSSKTAATSSPAPRS